MTRAGLYAATAALAVAGFSPVTASARPCSVFDRRPCTPTVCSVFDRHPCQPEFLPPIGQDLHLTVAASARVLDAGSPPDGSINTIAELFARLRSCWEPPAPDQAYPGMSMTIRLSFTRSGEIKGEPRFTYATKGVDADVKSRYQRTLIDALNRCTPLRFTDGMGGAVAGRPLTFHIIDDRQTKKTENPTEKAP